MAVFNVAGYLIEERRRWPVITVSPRGKVAEAENRDPLKSRGPRILLSARKFHPARLLK